MAVTANFTVMFIVIFYREVIAIYHIGYEITDELTFHMGEYIWENIYGRIYMERKFVSDFVANVIML